MSSTVTSSTLAARCCIRADLRTCTGAVCVCLGVLVIDTNPFDLVQDGEFLTAVLFDLRRCVCTSCWFEGVVITASGTMGVGSRIGGAGRTGLGRGCCPLM